MTDQPTPNNEPIPAPPVAKVINPPAPVGTSFIPNAPAPVEDEIIVDEVDPSSVKSNDMSLKFAVGTKVKVVDFPPPSSKFALDLNGLIGEIKGYMTDSGITLYDVIFEGIQVPFSRLNKVTGKLQRGFKKSTVYRRLDDTFLERAS